MLARARNRMKASEARLLEATRESMASYLSVRNYHTIRQYFERPTYRYDLADKWRSTLLLDALGVPTPTPFGFLHPRWGITIDGRPLLDVEHLYEFLQKGGVSSFAMKHVAGGTGDQVHIIDSIDRDEKGFALRRSDGVVLRERDVDEILRSKLTGREGFLIEERLSPHPWLLELAGGGLTSIRVNTLRCGPSQVRTQVAFLRLGVPDGATDHLVAGAVYVEIDVNDGSFGRSITAADRGAPYKAVKEHPTSGMPLEGLRLPCWQGVREVAERAATLTPGLEAIGWDVVLTKTGPKVIEGNIGWDVTLYQALLGGFLDSGVAREWVDQFDGELPDGSFWWNLRNSYPFAR